MQNFDLDVVRALLSVDTGCITSLIYCGVVTLDVMLLALLVASLLKSRYVQDIKQCKDCCRQTASPLINSTDNRNYRYDFSGV